MANLEYRATLDEWLRRLRRCDLAFRFGCALLIIGLFVFAIGSDLVGASVELGALASLFAAREGHRRIRFEMDLSRTAARTAMRLNSYPDRREE